MSNPKTQPKKLAGRYDRRVGLSTDADRFRFYVRQAACFVGTVVLFLTMCDSTAGANGISEANWTGTWATAPMRDTSGTIFGNQTLRQIVHTSVGGGRVRLRLSNVFGTSPLRLEDVHIALRDSGVSIVKRSDRQLRFGGQTTVLLAPGATAASDPISFSVPGQSDVAISLFLPGPTTSPVTFHASAHQTSYSMSGDVSGAAVWREMEPVGSYYFLSGLDVDGSSIKGAIVTLGASITEGFSTNDDTNHGWPDVLAGRLAAAGLNFGVLNMGISGNRLLASGSGPSAESRFERDVLEQPNVRWVIVSDEPINDLGSTKPPPSAADLIAGLQRLIARAHEQHIKFICSTLTPFEGANYWTAEKEVVRERFNSFLRSRESNCDAIVDQDRATHDPAHPTRYLAAFDHGDHLHPNDAGHKAIAESVDLAFFTSGGANR
jgi:lysophospholipase L1-like esterase